MDRRMMDGRMISMNCSPTHTLIWAQKGMIVKGLIDISFFLLNLFVLHKSFIISFISSVRQGEKEFLTIKYPVQSALKGEDVSWRNISGVKSHLVMMTLSCCDIIYIKKNPNTTESFLSLS